MEESQPIQIMFVQDMTIDGPPAVVSLPQNWMPKSTQPILRLVSLVCKGPIPRSLLKRMVVVTVDEVSPNALLYHDELHANGLLASVLTTVFLDSKTANEADVKLKLTSSTGAPLSRDATLRKLTVKLRSYPKNEILQQEKLPCVFHLQIH